MTISLVMTVLNEADSLGGFLETLSAQTLFPDEFVVVDGGSTDTTLEQLRTWSEAAPFATRVIVDEGASISRGRNVAIAEASGDFVAVTDGGTRLDPDWLRSLAEAAEGGADVVSGFFEPQFTSFWSSAIGATITPLLDEIDPETFLPSSRSVMFRRDLWEKVGGYPEWLDYCEDLVFDLALKEAGAEFAFAPTAVVAWDARPSLRAYAKQYYRYARGDGKADLWRKRHIVRYSVYAGAVVLGATAARGHRWPTLVAAAGGSAYARKYVRRVYLRRAQIGARWPAAAAAVPAVMALGDVAKMAGYPAGVAWRRGKTP